MTKLRLGQINTSDIESSVFASANALNTVQSNLTANIYNTYTSLSANIDSVQANVYALTLDTVATNGNVTTASIEVAGLLSSGDLTVSGPTTLNSNVVINGSITTVNSIQLNTGIYSGGTLVWNSSDGTLDIQTGYGDVVLQTGQETHYIVRNSTGSDILIGTALYCSGVTGGSGRKEVSPMIGDGSISPVDFLGLATHDITNGVNGVVTYFGYIRDLDTRGTANTSISVGDETWAIGDKLYVHPTVEGKLTNIEPEAPNTKICVAAIITRHQTVGVLFVRPTTNLDLGRLSDVQANVKSDGDVLTYVSGNARWEPKSASADESNLYNTYTTVTGLIDTVQDNVTSLTSTVDNIDANIYNTYNALSGFIDTVQDNVAASTSTNVTIFTASDLFTVSTSNTFNLSRTVNNARDIFVSLSGVTQYPGVGYTVSDNVLTISNTAPLKQGLEIEVRHLIGEAGTRGNSWQEINSSVLLNARSRVIVDSSSTAVTLTLPSSPLLGDEVRIIDGAGNVSNNAITLYGNGSNIEADSSNVVVDVDRSAFTLVYYNTYHGWVFGEK